MVSPQRRQQAIKPEQIYNQSHGLRQFEYPETESLADYLQTVDQLSTRLPLTQYQPNNHENQSMELYNPNQKSFNGMTDRRPHLVHQTINQNAGNPSILISLNTTAGEQQRKQQAEQQEEHQGEQAEHQQDHQGEHQIMVKQRLSMSKE